MAPVCLYMLNIYNHFYALHTLNEDTDGFNTQNFNIISYTIIRDLAPPIVLRTLSLLYPLL